MSEKKSVILAAGVNEGGPCPSCSRQETTVEVALACCNLKIELCAGCARAFVRHNEDLYSVFNTLLNRLDIETRRAAAAEADDGEGDQGAVEAH